MILGLLPMSPRTKIAAERGFTLGGLANLHINQPNRRSASMTIEDINGSTRCCSCDVVLNPPVTC